MRLFFVIIVIVVLGALCAAGPAAACEWPDNWLGPADTSYRALHIGVFYHAAVLQDLPDQEGNPALPGDAVVWLDKLAALPQLELPVMQDELARVRYELAQAARFYWRNSRFNCALDYDWIVDFEPRLRSTIADPEAPWFRPVDAPYYSDARENYDGLCQIMVLYKYDEESGELKRVKGGGGWTWGAEGDDGPCGWSWWAACTADNACGSDWLLVHEFGHQLDSLFDVSGHPEFWFNHLAPAEGNIACFGEHFDANSYILRRTPEQDWLDLDWGTLRTYVDADADGVPDSDDWLVARGLEVDPDSAAADTDGDGLSDFSEFMASNGLSIGHGERLYPALQLCNPQLRDSDSDGLRDGLDPLPMAPLPEFIPRIPAAEDMENYAGPASVMWTNSPDGLNFGCALAYQADVLADDEEEITSPGYLELAVSWGDSQLPEQELELKVMLDLDNDGWFAGRDNYRLLIAADGTVEIARHDASSSTEWPHVVEDAVASEAVSGEASVLDPAYQHGLRLRLDKADFPELAAKPGERIGVNIGVREAGWAWYYTLAEPNSLMPLELR